VTLNPCINPFRPNRRYYMSSREVVKRRRSEAIVIAAQVSENLTAVRKSETCRTATVRLSDNRHNDHQYREHHHEETVSLCPAPGIHPVAERDTASYGSAPGPGTITERRRPAPH